jgi:signal recognition particle GTPase
MNDVFRAAAAQQFHRFGHRPGTIVAVAEDADDHAMSRL